MTAPARPRADRARTRRIRVGTAEAVNAIQMKSMLRDEPVPAPDTLYAPYEEELRGWAYPD